MPPLVASADVPTESAQRIRDALLRVHQAQAIRSALDDALIKRFAAPDPAAYAYCEHIAQEALRAGYATPA